MKLILGILVFSCCRFVLGQNDQKNYVIVIKEYHTNGKLYQEYEFDTVINTYAGYFIEFDTLGERKMKGSYKIVDSVKCKDCYVGHPEYPDNPSSWSKREYSSQRSIKTGHWEFYHPNGEEAIEGKYAEIVHENMGQNFPNENEYSIVQNIWLHSEQLKQGYWFYYDEQGRLIRQEEYVDGVLVYVIK